MAKVSESITTRKTDEKQRNIDLIEHVSHQIVGVKLPSNRQVLELGQMR